MCTEDDWKKGRDIGIPKIRKFGTYKESKVLLMDLLGEDLGEKISLFVPMSEFPAKHFLLIAKQAFSVLQHIHWCDGNITPDNMVTGRNGDKSKIFIIDYKFARKYRLENGDHKRKIVIVFREHRCL